MFFLCKIFYFFVDSTFIYYSMDRNKSHRNKYFTISASTRTKFPSEVAKESNESDADRSSVMVERNSSLCQAIAFFCDATGKPFALLQERMYRLLTDILMSKTIQFSLLEFPIFHNAKSEDKVVRFISSFIFHDTFLLKVIARTKSFTRAQSNLLIRSESTSHIQLIFHAVIRRKERSGRVRTFLLV